MEMDVGKAAGFVIGFVIVVLIAIIVANIVVTSTTTLTGNASIGSFTGASALGGLVPTVLIAGIVVLVGGALGGLGYMFYKKISG